MPIYWYWEKVSGKWKMFIEYNIWWRNVTLKFHNTIHIPIFNIVKHKIWKFVYYNPIQNSIVKITFRYFVCIQYTESISPFLPKEFIKVSNYDPLLHKFVYIYQSSILNAYLSSLGIVLLIAGI